jgi:hypothetical protein
MMPPRYGGRETVMRRAFIVLALLWGGAAIDGSVAAAYAAGKIRLAQTSTLTNCMMTCNAQAATCHATCLIAGTPVTGATTTTSNVTVSTACQVNCSTQQISCQTVCAQTSPSQ